MRRWGFILLWAACLSGIGLLSLPVSPRVETYQSRPPAWSMRQSRPVFLRAGEAGVLSLELRPPAGLEDGTQSVSTRLELEGLVLDSAEAGEAIQPAGSAFFSWRLLADAPGTYAGRLWIYAGDPPELLNVRPVEIEVRGPSLVILWALRLGLTAAAGTSGWLALRRRRRRGNAPNES